MPASVCACACVRACVLQILFRPNVILMNQQEQKTNPESNTSQFSWNDRVILL